MEASQQIICRRSTAEEILLHHGFYSLFLDLSLEVFEELMVPLYVAEVLRELRRVADFLEGGPFKWLQRQLVGLVVFVVQLQGLWIRSEGIDGGNVVDDVVLSSC